MRYFLTNFARWEAYTGIENSELMILASKSSVIEADLKSFIQSNLLLWDKAETRNRPLNHLSYPTHGNQSGFMVDNEFVGLGSLFSNFYGEKIIQALGENGNKILEVGGGFGKLFSFIKKNTGDKSLKYIDLDIPEILCCASYYLMKSNPDCRVALFGEHPDISTAIQNAYFVLYPNWAIMDLPDNCADIFINKNSLGEMGPKAAQTYIKESAKRVSQIWFLNHEFMQNSFENGKTSLLNREYNIPSDFELISRYPDTGHLLYNGLISDIYAYHYVHKSKFTEP